MQTLGESCDDPGYCSLHGVGVSGSVPCPRHMQMLMSQSPQVQQLPLEEHMGLGHHSLCLHPQRMPQSHRHHHTCRASSCCLREPNMKLQASLTQHHFIQHSANPTYGYTGHQQGTHAKFADMSSTTLKISTWHMNTPA